MIIKISRQKSLSDYPSFPLRGYNYDNDEEEFSYPKIYSNYLLTLSSKSFKGHIKKMGIELAKLVKDCGFGYLIFLGDTELPWLNQDNDYKPAKEAQEYLIDNKVGKRYNGALQVDISELPIFITHLGWLTRCNASLPYFHFIDSKQNIIGHICKYGNLHIDTLTEVTDKLFRSAVTKTNLKNLDANSCYNQFGKTSALAGRKIIF